MIKKSNPKNDTNYINIARGIAIICIVLGHARCPEYLWRFFSFFHVPAFFFISGFFYKPIYTENPFLFLKKKLKSLYIPFIKYELVFLVFHNLFFKLNLYNESFTINGHQVLPLSLKQVFLKAVTIVFTFGSTEEAIWGFWFIQSLFTISILFALLSWTVDKYFSNKEEFRCFLVALIFLIGIFMAERGVYLPRSMVSAFVGIFFYYVGFLFSRRRNDIPYNWLGFIISLSVMLISLLLYDEHLGFANHHYVRFQYFVVNAMMGIYLLFFVSRIIDKTKLSFFFGLIGENTLHILALHILSFKIVQILQVGFYCLPHEQLAKYPVINSGGLWWVLYTFLGILIPVSLCQSYGQLKKSLTR